MKTIQKISAFEFAIMQVSDPEGAKDYEPYTRDEELEQRRENLKRQASQIVIQKPNP